jgi:hypothetical protein
MKKCFSSLYFLALKSVGKGSVPHIIWNIYKFMLYKFLKETISQKICLFFYLEHVLHEVLFCILVLSVPFQYNLTKIRKIDEAIPEQKSVYTLHWLKKRALRSNFTDKFYKKLNLRDTHS